MTKEKERKAQRYTVKGVREAYHPTVTCKTCLDPDSKKKKKKNPIKWHFQIIQENLTWTTCYIKESLLILDRKMTLWFHYQKSSDH